MFGRTSLGLLSLLLSLALAQEEEVVGNSILDLFKPDARITGGLQSVLDRVHGLDRSHTSCGKRQMCEALSATTEIRRSDGQVVVHKGWLRPYVDTVVELVASAATPLLYRVGLGPLIARQDVTFFDFILDMIDSSIIWAGHVIAGRGFSRQFEVGAGPLRTLVSALPQPPFRHLPDIVDLAVDLTGVFDRQRGTFQYMRAGAMGYWKGGEVDEDEAGICDYLYTGDEDPCDSYWSLIPQINHNGATETLRQGPSNPLSNQASYKFSGFEWEDLANPKYVFCKVDNYLSAIDGHVNPVEEASIAEVPSNIVIVRKLENETDEAMKQREKEACIEMLETEEDSASKDDDEEASEDYEYDDEYEGAGERVADVDKFRNYCTKVTDREMARFEREQKREMCKKMIPKSASSAPNPLSFVNDIKFVGNNPLEALLATPNNDEEESEDEKSPSSRKADIPNNLVIIDKIELNEDPTMDMEQAVEIINLLSIEEERGVVQNVQRVTTKKGIKLLLEVDSSEYRDRIIKQYRSQRSSISARLRKPKAKELKQLAKQEEAKALEKETNKEIVEEIIEEIVEESQEPVEEV